MRTLIVAISAAALAGAALSGCSFSVNSGGTPTVAKADLEKSITDKLGTGSEQPRSVTCPGDLEGVAGKNISCEVVVSDTNAFQAVVTVDKLEGQTVDYTMTPALTQAQVEKAAVDILASANNGQGPQSATCDSGLEGKQGTTVRCQLIDPGQSTGATVTVKSVDGLVMNLNVRPD